MNSKRILSGLLMIVFYIAAHAQEQDPFQPYLTGRPPVIEEDLGTEIMPDGIRIHRFVFAHAKWRDSPRWFSRPSHILPAKGPSPECCACMEAVVQLISLPPSALRKKGYASLVLDVPGVAGAKSRSPKTTGPWLNKPMIGAKPDATTAVFSMPYWPRRNAYTCCAHSRK